MQGLGYIDFGVGEIGDQKIRTLKTTKMTKKMTKKDTEEEGKRKLRVRLPLGLVERNWRKPHRFLPLPPEFQRVGIEGPSNEGGEDRRV